MDIGKSEKELQDFVYAVSHDLSAPIHQVLFFAKELKDRLEERLSEDENADLDRIVSGCKQLQGLVNDLLEYSRVSSQKGAGVAADLTDILEEVLYKLDDSVRDKNAVVELGALPVVFGNRCQIMQIFFSLLDNALKFSSPDRSPHIQISSKVMGVEPPGMLPMGLFWVSDNGLGIEEKFHKDIFTIFRKLQGGRKNVGSGLGLTLSKRIVENHGGAIWVESSPGAGSTFYFTLPLV